MGFATQIDAANWNYKQDLKLSERAVKNLNLGTNVKIDGETKTLFMYLLLMGHFIKVSLALSLTNNQFFYAGRAE